LQWIHSIWLKVSKKVLYRQQPWKGSLEAVSWQGFEQEDIRKGFGNEPIIFHNDEVASNGVDDSHSEIKGRRNPPKRQFGSKSCSEA
jgi:hypothetical protein